MNVDNVSRDDWILGGIALLLVIDLFFLPWFSGGGGTVNIGGATVTVGGATLTATDDPNGIFGILAVLLAIAVIVDLGIERLSPQTQIPAIGGSRAVTRFYIAGGVALFVALKFLFEIHFSIFGFGFYAGVVLTVALVVFASRLRAGAPAVMSTPPGPPPGAGPGGPPPAGPAV